MEYILSGGLIYDGTTNKPFYGDIHVVDDKIVKVDSAIDIAGIKRISLEGKAISPGWIDAHSHNDFFLYDNHLEQTLPFLKQGITSQVVGNCGFSAYGLDKDNPHKDLIGGGLFACQEVNNLKEFALGLKGKLMQNIIPLVGHGSVRFAVKGNSRDHLSSQENEELIRLTQQAMEEGAFGGSFGLMYMPGMFSSEEELVNFAKVIASYDGILTIHPRSNSKIALGYPLITKKSHLELGLDEVIRIMEKSGVRVEYSHLIFVGKSSWPLYDKMMASFKKARDKGFDITYDMYSFTYGASVITVVLPSWYLKLNEKQKKNKWNRFKLKLIISITKKLLGIEFSDMIVTYINKEYSHYEGLSVAEIAKLEKMSNFDTYLKLVDLSNGEGRIMLGKYYNDKIIKDLMQDPLTIYMTDAWVEKTGAQNASAYQAFPYFIIRAKEDGFPLEQVINKMTGLTAERFRIPKRGFIKEGYYADFTVFDPDEMTVDLTKPDHESKGIKMLIINGEIVLEDGKYLDKYVGEFILKSKNN